MSRIGKLKIEMPKGTTAAVDGRKVTVKGKLGELAINVHPSVAVELEGDVLRVKRQFENKETRALHGLTRSLLANMVHGVSQGFSKTLEIQGVGYKAEMKKDMLVMNIGYSHPIEYKVPVDVEIKTDNPTTIVVSGIDKERVGQVSADLRKFRPPDAYKGKGIRYKGEKIKLKPGKSGV